MINTLKTKADIVIKNCSQILTCKESSLDLVGLIENGWIAIKGEKIVAVGNKQEIDKNIDYCNALVIDGSGKVAAPGFVDCHTHLVFGGSRVKEYVAKLTCDNLDSLTNKGIKTGIYASIDMTREAREQSLIESSLKKLNKMLAAGTTTVEIKSGYGLDLDTEIKQLKVNEKLKNITSMDIYSTFLGAHGWPKDTPKEKYIDYMIKEVMPIVSENKLAQFCDIWCDDGYYTAEESYKVLKAARDMGLEPKIHTDAYSYIYGSDLAADMKMVSADHLNYTPLKAVKKLAEARVPGVLLPGTDFSVNHPKPFDPRPMIESGMIIALGTNLNPGNWIESMQFIMALACRRHKMTPEEAIRASTLGGAFALGIEKDRGSLEVDKLADIQIWDTPTYEDVIYKLGGNLVSKVIKRGKLVIDNSRMEG